MTRTQRSGARGDAGGGVGFICERIMVKVMEESIFDSKKRRIFFTTFEEKFKQLLNIDTEITTEITG